MTTTTINGRTYSDGSEPGIGLAGGGHRTLLLPLVSDIVAVASQVATHAETAEDKAAEATVSSEAAAASVATAGAAAAVATGAATQAQAAAAVAQAIALGVSTGRPASRPSLLMPLASGRALDPRASIARASSAWRTNELGLLVPELAGAPRFGFSRATLVCRGMWIEEARTNLHLRSNDFSTGWTASNASNSALTAAAGVALDGTNTAGSLLCTTTADASRRLYSSSNITVTPGATYAGSIDLKSVGGWTWAGVTLAANTTLTELAAAARINLQTGEVFQRAGSLAVATDEGGGWWRVGIAGTIGASTGYRLSAVLLDSPTDDVSSSAVGVVGAGVLAWAPGIEAGSSPSSRILTGASQVTRAAETCNMSVSGWLRQGEGTLYAEFMRPYALAAGSTRRVLTLHDGTESNRVAILLSHTGSADEVNAVITTGGADTFGGAPATYTAGATVKVAIAYRANDAVLYVNGTLAWAGNAGAVPAALTTLALGTDSAGSSNLNGLIGRVAYWPGRLLNAQLQVLTAA